MNYANTLNERKVFSEKVIGILREKLLNGSVDTRIAVVVSGSFARKDASEESDVDYFLLIDSEQEDVDFLKADILKVHELIKDAIAAACLRTPSLDGAFGQGQETCANFLKNVGGKGDPNDKLTRRMLLLLEGNWLFGQDIFEDTRRKLIADVYVKSAISDHQIARFFLNDLIRYWRTIGVDFEFKTTEIGKGWGIRNIKLVYSRKLMYFSGILMVAETAQSTRNTKVARLLELAAMTPLERLDNILGTRCEQVINLYAHFLEEISKPDVRARFESVTLDDRKTQTEEFRALKNAGHHFSLHLESILEMTYPSGHPIHHAMLF